MSSFELADLLAATYAKSGRVAQRQILSAVRYIGGEMLGFFLERLAREVPQAQICDTLTVAVNRYRHD